MKRLIILAAAVTALAVGGPPAQAQPEQRGAPAPGGDYWRTCRNVSTYGYGDDATMTAQCQDNRGRWRNTSLRFGRCREIANRDGDLICRDGGGGQPPWGGGGRPPPPWGGGGGGRPPWNSGSLTLFSGPNFQGQPFQTYSEITNLPKQYNDRALSVRIEGRGAWQICTDANFKGRCQTIDRDVPDLRRFGFGEAVTSMRPVR